MVSKRGRKRKNEMYFGPNEEEAVIKFLQSKNQPERNLIFNEHLKAPLDKMIESIIRRYKLYRKRETFEELHSDTMSFLITKAHKFESGRGKKAYSYFGTICKHYILGLLIKDEKQIKQISSYDDMAESIEEREDLTYVIDAEEFSMDVFIKNLSDGIKNELKDENQPPKKKLNDNEKKVGLALIDILENWETAFESMNGGSKYNKNSVLETMRNYTNLSTKDIRLAMKRYKDLYELLKQHGL
jgi:lipopolysaccharide export LptBFGC system permease protein LptF